MDLSKKRIVFIDLDDTLIRTQSGATLPQGSWDMVMNIDVMQQLAKLQPNGIFIVSNQGGIEKGYVHPFFFEHKMLFVISALQEYVGQGTFVAGKYCPTIDPQNQYRKPNCGMLQDMFQEFSTVVNHEFTVEDCIMIGDASGKEGDFSDSDRKCAVNFGCDYMDVKEFITADITEPMYKLIHAKNGQDSKVHGVLFKKDAKELAEKLNTELGAVEYIAVQEGFIPPTDNPNTETTHEEPVSQGECKPQFKVVKS